MDEYDVNDFEEPRTSSKAKNSPSINNGSSFAKPFSMHHFNKGSMKIFNNVVKQKNITNDSPRSKLISSQSNLNSKPLIKQLNQSRAETIFNNHFNSKGIEFIDKTLLAEEHKFKKILQDKSKMIERWDKNKKISFLSNENKQIREELKILNELFTILIENQKKNMLKTNKKKNQGLETNRELKQKELENLEKISKNLETEHFKLSQRLSEISNPFFMKNTLSRNEKLSEQIKMQEKKNKLISSKQKINEFKVIQGIKYKENEICPNDDYDYSNIEIERKLEQLAKDAERLKDLKTHQDKLQIECDQKIEELSKGINNIKTEFDKLNNLNKLNKNDKQSDSAEIVQLEMRKMSMIKSIDALKNKLKLSKLEYVSQIKNKEKEIGQDKNIINELEKSFKEKQIENNYYLAYLSNKNNDEKNKPYEINSSESKEMNKDQEEIDL